MISGQSESDSPVSGEERSRSQPQSRYGSQTVPSDHAAPSVPPARSHPLSGARGVVIGLGMGVILTLVGMRFVGGESDPAPSAEAPAQSQGVAQTVTTASAVLAPVQDTLAISGTVKAVDLLQVAPQVGGLQIRQVLVREGDFVEAGQTLAVLDDEALQAQIRQETAQLAVAEAQVRQQLAALAQAEATLNEARQNLERYRSLAARGAVSQEELTSRETQAMTAQEAVGVAQANVESAEAGIQSQQAEIDRLRTQQGQTVVRAPAAGTVAERFATVGDVSASSSPLFSLIQNDQLELNAEVPQVQLSRINLGAPVKITSRSDPRLQLQGTVRDINPVVNEETRIAIVNVSLPASNLLRQGMFLQGAIVTGSRQGVTVPVSALLPQQEGDPQVFVLASDNQVTARTVEIGARLPAEGDRPARVEIRQGLQPGEQVVTTGAGYLQEGDSVQVVDNP